MQPPPGAIVNKPSFPLRPDRREFLRTSALGLGGLALGGWGLLASSRGRPGVAVRNPLYLPPLVAPTGLTLDAAPALVDLGGGRMSQAWAYNGGLPGPTLQVRSGDRATMTLVNGLDEDTITHWHGMLVDEANDAHPMYAITPGASYAYDFTVNQRACMNWYHPHPHMRTGAQVNYGLAGAFLVRDAEEDALGLPSGRYELPLIIRDANLDKTGNLSYTARRGGFEGKIGLVNGTIDAGVEVDRALYRLRIVNGANARIFNLALGNGAAFLLIGNDGGLLERPVALGSVMMSPAERVDILVDFSAAMRGDRIMLRDLDSGWDLLEFSVTGSLAGSGGVPAVLSSIPRLSPDDVVNTRTFSFDGMSRINGQVYDMHRIDLQVPLGVTERWVFRSAGNAPHPVHVHAAPFQVQSRSGGSGVLQPWEQGWKDTVLLGDGETVEVLIRFEAHRGVFLLHCHKLEHEDMGMMLNFEIV